MAKMRVHELATELDIQSKEIVTFLSEKNIDVKNHMSTLEDDAISMVKKQFAKKSAPAADAVKREAPVKEAAAPKAAPAQKAAAQDAAKESGEVKKERPKKKASISAVYNPQNSKMGDRRNGGSRNRNNQTRVTNERPTRPARPAGDRPVRAAGDRPVRPAGDRPVRPAGDRPVRAAGDRPVRPTGDRPVRPAGDRPVRPAGDRPVRPAGEKAAEKTAPEKTVQQTAPETTARPAEEPKTTARLTGERVIGDRTVRLDDPNAMERSTRQNDRGQRPNNDRNQRGDRTGRRYNNDRPQRQEGDRNERSERKDFNGQKGYQNNRSHSGNNQGNRNNRQDGQNRFKDTKRVGGGNRAAQDAPKASLDELRGKDSRNNNTKKKKPDYDNKKNKKQENFVNLEKKTGHKKRNAVPQNPAEKKTDEVRTITLPEVMTVRELADAMKVQASEIVKKLFMQGIMMTVNQEIDYEKAEEIALEFNCIAEPEEKVDVIAELLKEEEEDEDTMVTRPPVVCVMGHVDHGKTSLLDAIRNTRVTDKEAGGITQAIGASVVKINGQRITFLDTPGHEAFTAMRMRGANSTDIAILVVAADDGIMPQTVEAINHAKAAGVEIIVAINKIDKEGANVERVKQELTEYELIAEDWGGSTICVPVSAKTGEGITDLLEMVLLSAEVLELKANPKRNARGLVIEAQLDKGRGAVATVLVQKGTLKVGQAVACGSSFGKVRAMIDDKGKRVKEAGPSTPVEILGLNSVPNAGEVFVVCDTEKEARSFAETFVSQDKEKLLAETRARMSLDDLFSQIQAGNLKDLNLIVKADVQGSVEAVKQSLTKLTNEEVVVKVIHGGVGAINESDVSLAAASNAIIIGFNVKPDPIAKSTAEQEEVDIRLYDVIYKAIEDIEAAMKGMLDPVFEEQVIGHAEIRQIFKASGVGMIAGSYVLDGIFERNCKIRITREGNQIYEGALASLKRFKDDVKEVRAGYECGLVFEGFNDIAELDIVEAYKMVEVPR